MAETIVQYKMIRLIHSYNEMIFYVEVLLMSDMVFISFYVGYINGILRLNAIQLSDVY